MNEVIICKPSPIKILTISRSPLVELLNFLIYGRHPELLNERARRQPFVFSEKMPRSLNDLKDYLAADECDNNKKLFFDCEKGENQATVLLDNQGAQFWIHYFRCGVGLVNLSFFKHLASAEGSLSNRTRGITRKSEYQWFAHDLGPEIFTGETSEKSVEELGDYFVERVNPALVSPYSICFESSLVNEPYKFVSGSLEKFKEVLTWALCLRSVETSKRRERKVLGQPTRHH